MKVILLKDVPSLGKEGQIKEVAEGYARNFLFPRHTAVQASAQELKRFEGREEKKRRDSELELKHTQELVSKIEGLELRLKVKANEQGLLYAAVGPQKVVEAAQKKGVALTKDQVRMTPVKKIGEHAVRLVFGHGLEVNITLVIVGEK